MNKYDIIRYNIDIVDGNDYNIIFRSYITRKFFIVHNNRFEFKFYKNG